MERFWLSRPSTLPVMAYEKTRRDSSHLGLLSADWFRSERCDLDNRFLGESGADSSRRWFGSRQTSSRGAGSNLGPHRACRPHNSCRGDSRLVGRPAHLRADPGRLVLRSGLRRSSRPIMADGNMEANRRRQARRSTRTLGARARQIRPAHALSRRYGSRVEELRSRREADNRIVRARGKRFHRDEPRSIAD